MTQHRSAPHTPERPAAPAPTAPLPPAKRPSIRHNLGTVVDFEFTRTLKKRGFWIATLAIPVVMAVVFALVYVSSSATSASEDAQPVKVYGTDQGVFENGKYDAVAKHLLITAARAGVGSAQLTASGEVTTESQAFRDGQATGGFGSVVPPLMFLLIFYVSIILLFNQMLNSTLEEKENRVTEMISVGRFHHRSASPPAESRPDALRPGTRAEPA
jgi:ABC-2 type transport system permease protein